MLTNCLKIPDTTETEFFGLIFFKAYQKIQQKYCHSELSSVLDELTC